MAPVEFSEEWNATCGQRPATIRIDSQVGAPFLGFSWFLNIVTIVVVPPSLLLFAWARTKWTYIRKRNFTAIVLCGIGAILSCVVGPLRDILGRETFPCDTALWVRIFAVVLMNVSIIYMLNFFRDQLLWSKALSAISFQKLQEVIGDDAVRRVSTRPTSTKIADAPDLEAEEVASKHSGQHSAKGSAKDSARMHSSHSSFDESAFYSAMYKQSYRYKVLVLTLPFLPPLILGLVYQFSVPYYGHGCVGCVDDPVFMAVLLGAVMIPLLNVNYNLYYLKGAHDPLHILGDMKLMVAGGSGIGMPGMLGVMIDTVIGRPYDRAVFSFDWLTAIGIIWFFVFLCPVPVLKAYLDSRRVTSNKIDLKALLANLQFQKLFAEHLVSEWSIENLKFYNQITSFRDHYGGFKTSKDANLVALQTFETFVRPGGVMEVNISSRLRDRLTNEFSVLTNNNKDLHSVQIERNIFDEAQEEILELMERDSFSRFQRTKAFQDFAAANLIVDTTSNAMVVVTSVAN